MKKILSIFLILILVLTMSLVFTACGSGAPAACLLDDPAVTVNGSTPAQVIADFFGAILRLALLAVLLLFTKIIFPFL